MGHVLSRSLAAVGMLTISLSGLADPVTIVQPFMNLENDGINSLGFAAGDFLRIGATSVTPNFDDGTFGYGTTTNLLTNQPVSRTIYFDPGPAIPNFFARYLTDNPALYGPWVLTFVNGSQSNQAVVSLPAGQTQAPFVNSITLSGTSQNPTFSWTPPSGTAVNGYRINIYDKSLISNTNNGDVASANLQPSTTSFTVNASDFTAPGYSFQLGRNYSISIDLIQTKDDSSSNLANSNVAAISRAYADFTPSATSGPPVNLPVTLVNGQFQFNIAVVPGQTYYIDPAVAAGYDYRIGAGNPDFKSVVLPTNVGDGLYDIYGIGPGNQTTLLAHDWAGGTVFDFAGNGVSAFRVSGIDPADGLDPADVTAFVTGLTFEGSGLFTGTQTPLVVNLTAVPEPCVWCLMLLSLPLIFRGLRGRVSNRETHFARSPRSDKRLIMRRLFVMIPMLAALPLAFAAPGFDGKWGVSFGQSTRMSGEVTISDGTGTWTVYGGGGASKNNPCLNKRFPAVVKSVTDAEVTIDIDGNSVLKGCLTETLVLHPGADGAWTGMLGSGLAMTWARE